MAGSSRPRSTPYVPVLTPVPGSGCHRHRDHLVVSPCHPRDWHRDPWSFVTSVERRRARAQAGAGYRWHRPVSGSAHGDVCVPSRRVVSERRRQETAAALADTTSLSRSQRFSGCSLPQAVPMPTAVESRERIFSTRIEPSESPDRRGFRGQVSAESWGHPSPLVLARVGQDREIPPTKVARHPATAGTQRTSLHRLQARANSRSDLKMRTSIKRPSLLVVADLCRPLARRGSSPSTLRSPLRADAPVHVDGGPGPGPRRCPRPRDSVLRMSILQIADL